MNTIINVPYDSISSLLCCAFEGGVGYWCQLTRYTLDDEGILDYDSLADTAQDLEWVVVDLHSNREAHTVTPRKLQHGLSIMAEKCPVHFGHLIEGMFDSTTGDVFLQCALFGEIVYG